MNGGKGGGTIVKEAQVEAFLQVEFVRYVGTPGRRLRGYKRGSLQLCWLELLTAKADNSM